MRNQYRIVLYNIINCFKNGIETIKHIARLSINLKEEIIIYKFIYYFFLLY